MTQADVSDTLKPLFHEATITGTTLLEGVAEAVARREVSPSEGSMAALTTAYTMAFEAGVALALAYPQRGREMLDAIDHEVLEDDPRALVERARYLDHLLGVDHG